jgi:hypothetical protein
VPRPSARCPCEGGQRLAQLYLATNLARMGASVRIELVDASTASRGLLRFVDGQLESAQAIETDGERIVRIRAQRNPDKLARIAQLFSSK